MARAATESDLQLSWVTTVAAIIAALMVALGSYGVITDLTDTSHEQSTAWSLGGDDGTSADEAPVATRPGGPDLKAIYALRAEILADYRTR